ncbi:MAG: short-chain dehydrogenase [Gammaproteobacteria bacterium]|nr:MAG: short-chain dehydrogenase [Gammaproteobacteria bacterium]
MGKLDGKVAVITGGAMGMGFGSARVMADQGAKIALFDFSETVYKTAESLNDEGYEVLAFKLDVRIAQNLKDGCKSVAEHFGKIDILVNAAGIGVQKYFLDASDEFRDLNLDINYKGTWNACKAVIPYMLEGKYGKIVNFCSVTGCLVVDPGMTAYAATKGAILAFTKALAVEFAPNNITVNAILPGMIDTPMTDKSCREACPEDPQSIKDSIAEHVPMKRLGTIEEAGKVTAFLASDDSSYITGTSIVFDGGNTLPETPGSGWAPQ